MSTTTNRLISLLLFFTISSFSISCKKPVYDIGIIAGTVINGTGNEPLKSQLILINSGVIVDIVDGKNKDDYHFKRLIDATDKSYCH